MARLEIELPDEIVVEARKHAERLGVSVSRYLGEMIERQLRGDWPEGYFDSVIGAWKGKGLSRADQGQVEERNRL